MYVVSILQRMTENLSQEQLNTVPERQILFKGSISTWKKQLKYMRTSLTFFQIQLIILPGLEGIQGLAKIFADSGPRG